MSFCTRQYDPQIGRFLQIDPLAAFGGQDMMSPYAAMGNMPEMMVDPLGLMAGFDKDNPSGINSNEGGGFSNLQRPDYMSLGGGGGRSTDIWNALSAFGKGGANAQSSYYVTVASRIAFWNTVKSLPQGSYYVNNQGGIVDNTSGQVVYGKGPGGANKGGDWAYLGKDAYNKNRFFFKKGLSQVDNTPITATREGDQYVMEDDAAELQASQNEGSNWYSTGGQLNWVLSAGSSTVQTLSGIARLGSNLKIYSATARGRVFMGNQYVKTFSIARGAKFLGIASVGIGTVMDIRGMQIYRDNPDDHNAVSPNKAGLNFGMGVYGLTGAGAIPSLLYFGIDAFYPGGWQQAAIDQDKLYQENRAIDPNWQL